MLDWLDCRTKVCPYFFSFFLGFCPPSSLWHDSLPLTLLEENNVFVCILNLFSALLQGDYYLGRLEDFKITILWLVIASIFPYYIWNICTKEAIFKENAAYSGPNHWICCSDSSESFLFQANAFSLERWFDLTGDVCLINVY